MSSPVITEDLAEELADRKESLNSATGRRWTYRQISVWLAAERGVVVSYECVRRTLLPLLAERAEARRDTIRERLTEQLAAQLDALDALMLAARGEVLTSRGVRRKNVDGTVVLEALDRYRKAIETKLKFSGVGERVEVDADVSVDAEVTVVDARDELAEILTREATVARRDRS